ncbi:MAG: hypothetical protein F6J90_12070 [Moorea sp. SIOASIH]|uniref:hypothetical protein n=1 Tax=Moorena sp. SIOASIH TaxID=2607817 RepID=UPI0013BD5ADD|nr:hypothetical protein [Moorena sp. SIOASIH]NEO37007.1 hypothetical protein [Moorena sp. SIOASIH]
MGRWGDGGYFYKAMQRGLGEAARSWGGSAVLGETPMSDCRSPSDCRGFPHERLHQDRVIIRRSYQELGESG